MTREEIEKAPSEKFSNDEWKPLIDFFWERYQKRYFNQIKSLQEHDDYEIRNNCGFLITTIDCILIETLEQYYAGKSKTEGNHTEAFLSFFQRANALKEIIKDYDDAGYFYGFVRSGLIHQSKTHKKSLINKKRSTPILDWVDPDNKNEGLKLNRDEFHRCVHEEYKTLIENLKMEENVELRDRFKSKLLTLID